MENQNLKHNQIRNALKNNLFNYATIIGLFILMIAYRVLSGKNFSAYSIEIIFNQTVVIAIIATGAIFIYSTGAFDISLGIATVLSAMMGVVIYKATNSVTMIFVGCILTGIICGQLTAILSSAFKLPIFITTIGMMSILASLVEFILNGNADITMDRAVAANMDQLWIRILIYGVFFLICLYLFNYTKLGRSNKFLGGNKIAAMQSGINPTKNMVITFLMVGIGVGLAAIIIISRAPTLSRGTASSLGMDVLLAVVFGGMPLSGGARSKITAAIVGSFSVVILTQVLIIMGADYGVNQVVKGILFLGLVFLASFSYKSTYLTR